MPIIMYTLRLTSNQSRTYVLVGNSE